ncbi:hypothetical protein A3K86_03830 [Photobacterium jeanii]|uniref:Aminotransferase class V domain-containing protein n=1 Tax=Photobacterium jeanii TaxID=858640 RepID=A0A178KLB3_9GAMM|nr:aminomethyl-transferring glycine dehydrogenase subunit GcvPB [Photobacterium jeanii]OAN18057.1 hypothetical protein A3K86_03830 [Photobacterium jeanii]PST92271.1 aminomethyl-transferring glycine dehydrogenase subunit GcvPB [Photobacterium jeanii]
MENIKLREFHQARWNEPVIMEMGTPGERGILIPQAEQAVKAAAGNVVSVLGSIKRKHQPALPEVNQALVNRHYIRLSQENLGADNALGISQGTCTLKYSPKVQEHMVRHPGLAGVHPLQAEESMQGILKMYYETEQIMKEIGGMDRISFLPASGGHAIYSNAQIISAYHKANGNTHKNEIITTLHSHPVDAAATAILGYRVITLLPDEKTGLPCLEEFKAALSDKTAGIFITNPEDTGIYNSQIDQFTQAAHDVGAICAYDQANANALLGIARAREAGFDLMHFNLHKSFSSPHGGGGPGCGALGCAAELAPFLPKPTVEFDGSKYWLDYDRDQSIGHVKAYLGNFPVVARAYMWCMSLGAEGLKQVAITSVLNNQYMTQEILEKVPGVSLHYAEEGVRRMEQTRLSFDKLAEQTGGLGVDAVNARIVDYGISELWQSHHPYTVPEPFTPEPCDSYNKDDMDYFVQVLKAVATDCIEHPEVVATAPNKASRHLPNHVMGEDFKVIATTWRQYTRRFR